jgi:hypothetical protein
MGIAVILVATARCGYPDFQFTSGSGGGGGGSSSNSGGGGENSSSSNHSSTTGMGTTTSTGGAPACRVLHSATDCGPKERCTIVDEETGATGCVPVASHPLQPYDACSGDNDCPTGTWCDGRTGVCMPFCQSAQDCGGNDCTAARNSGQNTVPGGVSVCVANCDPVIGDPCGQGATCTYDAQLGDMDCFVSLGRGFDDPCTTLSDCGVSYVCVGSTCQPWCHPAGEPSDDCFGGDCGMFSNLAPMYDGEVYGFCE